MKRIILAAIALAVCMTSLPAQETVKDTVKTQSERDFEVSDGRVHLDFDIPFYNKICRTGNGLDPGSIGLGMLSTNSASPFKFDVSQSIEVFCYGLTSHTRGNSTLSFGPGVSWKNFTMTGGTAMSKGVDGSIVTGPYPAGSKPKLSRLRVFSLCLPVLYSYNICDGYGFTFGPVLNINASSVINTKYSVNCDKQKDKYKNVHCNVATVDIMFQLNLDDFSLYVKYSPMDLMDKDYWPGFQQWSFGIAL